MVRYVRTKHIESLQDAVRAKVLLWALCRHCGHTHRFDPVTLAYKYGALTTTQLAVRMRCDRCGMKQAAICPDYKEWPGR